MKTLKLTKKQTRTLLQFTKRAQETSDEIGVLRDKLRDLMYEIEDQISDLDTAQDNIDTGIAQIQQGIDKLSEKH